MSSPDETLRNYADKLEREYGECVLGREALQAWLSQLLDRLAQQKVPPHAAMQMIEGEYVMWQAEVLGMDPNDGI